MFFGIYQTDECVTQEKFRCPKSLGASESLGAPEARTPFCLGQLGEGGGTARGASALGALSHEVAGHLFGAHT